jgi:hypothetical protein
LISQEKLSFITVATRRWLPQVALLAKSLKQHHPDHKLICYLVEDRIQEHDYYNDFYEIKTTEHLAVPGGLNFYFQYTPFELCCALKPYIIKDHLVCCDNHAVVYLDSDMHIYAPIIGRITNAFKGGSVLLSPHLLKPEASVNHVTFLKAGSYNAGIIAFTNNSSAMDVLDWWRARCAADCYIDVCGGVFVDQRWLDLAASLFPCITIMRDPGINVGHWNIHEKTFSDSCGQIMVDGNTLLGLFHFSGFGEFGLSRYLDQNLWANGIPDPIQKLSREYANQLNKIKAKRAVPHMEYSYGHFEDHKPISEEMREIVRKRLVECENPFCSREKIEAFIAQGNLDEIMNMRADRPIAHYRKTKKQKEKNEKHSILRTPARFWRKVRLAMGK